MISDRTCDFCLKVFKLVRVGSIGRFCSSLCNRKILRRNQLEKYRKYLENETEEQKMAWLKRHYEKFVTKSENGCWEWSGSLSNGYGNFGHRGKIVKAHRASWLIHKGPIPDSAFVLHSCDIRHCSNPEHLFLGNHTDNMRDMASKNRTKVVCKLSSDQVKEIRGMLELEIPMTKIGKKYNVSDVAIWNIKNNKTWKNK